MLTRINIALTPIAEDQATRGSMSRGEACMVSIESHLVRVIEARLRVTAVPSNRIRDLNLDSIKTAEFLSELEDEFEVRFDQDVLEVETVADLAAYIGERLADSPPRTRAFD